MSENSFPLGVQSYCFRRIKSRSELIANILELGLAEVELCGLHADFSRPEEITGIAGEFKQAGIAITSFGVQKFGGAPKEKAYFESARLVGARHISGQLAMDSYLQAIPLVRQWCREFDVRVGLHCHGGFSFGGQPEVIDYLTSLGGPEIGLCLDTAWAMQLGPRHGNPIEWVKRFGDRISAVHFKDFVFDSAAQWRDVPVGEGNLDLPGFVGALRDSGFNGVSVLEYEADPDNPLPALQKCVRHMREVLVPGGEDL